MGEDDDSGHGFDYYTNLGTWLITIVLIISFLFIVAFAITMVWIIKFWRKFKSYYKEQNLETI